MSSALSNVAAAFSISPHRRTPAPNSALHCVRAVRGQSPRDNLDHLRRSTTAQPQKTRTPPQSAPLGLWDRFPSARTVQQMMDTMDRIMEDPLAFSVDRASAAAAAPLLSSDDHASSYRRGRTPWEIKEKESEYKMRFDMPGMTKGDVKVSVEERMLVIKAEKVSTTTKGEGGEEVQEEEEEWSARSYGKYNTRIALPENVVVEKIKAEVKDGVLYVTVPKAEVSAKVLDIDVQ